MRCKKHYTDLSSAVGVCSCCLRERLLSLIAAQEQLNSDAKHRNSGNNPPFPRADRSAGAAACSDETRRKDYQHRPPAVPRHHHSFSDQLFYRTPPVDPNTGGKSKTKRSFIRLISFSNIFRSRNRKPVDSDTDPKASDSTFRSRGGINATSSSSSSWFSIISGGRRHRRKPTVHIDESTITAGRGVSPIRNDVVGDAFTNGYESTESLKNTPRRTPGSLHVRRGGSGGHVRHVRNVSGLTFCLSPLVRASPKLQWNQKVLPPDALFSGEIGAPVKPHLSITKSFCANRSRKLVDFGRPNLNR